MSHTDLAADELAALRSRAASRLAPAGGRASSRAAATDALAVLHSLALSPGTAGDALALLHELQVHQVELEMQAEALRESQAEMEAALQRQIALYDSQPVGCLSLDGRRTVHDLNLTAATMLGIDRGEAQDLAFDSLLAPASAQALQAWLAAHGTGDAQGVLTLQLASAQGAGRWVTAHLRHDSADQRCRVVLAPVAEPPAEACR